MLMNGKLSVFIFSFTDWNNKNPGSRSLLCQPLLYMDTHMFLHNILFDTGFMTAIIKPNLTSKKFLQIY